jgi:hypothetical protein
LRLVAEREKEAHNEQLEIKVVEDEVKDVNLGNVGLERFGENDKGDVVVVLIHVVRCIWRG